MSSSDGVRTLDRLRGNLKLGEITRSVPSEAPGLTVNEPSEPRSMKDGSCGARCAPHISTSAVTSMRDFRTLWRQSFLPPHAHVEHRADARVFERHLRKAEVRREEARRVWEQLAARLEGRGLEHRRGVVRRRERGLHYGPDVAVQRRERGLGVVQRWKRDVNQVDLGIVQHVLNAAVCAHVGEFALNDVASFLHEVADGRDRVKLRQLAQCGQMLEQTCAAKPGYAYAERPPKDLRFVLCLHISLFLR